MTPRRLLPLLGVFLLLGGAYFFLSWQQQRQDLARLEAKKLFQVKETEIAEIALKKGKEEIRLVRQGQDWEIVKPLKSHTDKVTVDSLLGILAHLVWERDLGEQKELKTYGLDQPALVLEFTAAGKAHRLRVGEKVPGGRGYYVLKDQDPRLWIIAAPTKGTLDRSLTDLRDKTLLTFSPDQVKAVKLRLGIQVVELEKTGPGRWRWRGRDQVPVRRDRLESFLGQLQLTQVKDFVAEAPKDLQAYGLAPEPGGEVTIVLEKSQESLLLGAKHQNGFYARKGAGGPVVLVGEDVMQRLIQILAGLADRRLWAGEIAQVQRLVWGTPPKLWTALKEKEGEKQTDYFKLTGPEQQDLRLHAARLEDVLVIFQLVEYEHLKPGGPAPGKVNFLLEIYDGAGKLLFRLEELGRPEKDQVELRLTRGEKTEGARISTKLYDQFQAALTRLSLPGQKPK